MNDYDRIASLPGWLDAIAPYDDAFRAGLLAFGLEVLNITRIPYVDAENVP